MHPGFWTNTFVTCRNQWRLYYHPAVRDPLSVNQRDIFEEGVECRRTGSCPIFDTVGNVAFGGRIELLLGGAFGGDIMAPPRGVIHRPFIKACAKVVK